MNQLTRYGIGVKVVHSLTGVTGSLNLVPGAPTGEWYRAATVDRLVSALHAEITRLGGTIPAVIESPEDDSPASGDPVARLSSS